MRNQRVSQPAPATEPPEETASGFRLRQFFRLRHVLFGLAVLGASSQLYPRIKAYFTLHDLATAAANYGLCMVGPTGAGALRDNPTEYAALLRRRLVTAEADEAPFATCAPLAQTLTNSVDFAQMHRNTARQFVEHGTGKPSAAVTLEQLRLNLGMLQETARAAWPFERAGYTHLVIPSSHAQEAEHPVAFSPPATGQGLPGWRSLYRSTWASQGEWRLSVATGAELAVYSSLDGGLSWRQTSLNQPGVAKHIGRCTAAGSERSFGVAVEGKKLVIQSLVGDATVGKVSFDGGLQPVTTSCDRDTLLGAVEHDGQIKLLSCTHGSNCKQLHVHPEWLDGHFDVARVEGVSVVASTKAGIVRVRSSRDDGQTWTPTTVAFDWGSQPTTTDVKIPSRLLVLGKSLLLYGAARSGQSYPVLVSLDYGASWRTPQAASPVAAKPAVPAQATSHPPAAPQIAAQMGVSRMQ